MVWNSSTSSRPCCRRSASGTRPSPPIMPKELNADPNIAQKTAIGTNYKILDKLQPSISIQYRKHPDYWGGDPFIDRWHMLRSSPSTPTSMPGSTPVISPTSRPTARDVLVLARTRLRSRHRGQMTCRTTASTASGSAAITRRRCALEGPARADRHPPLKSTPRDRRLPFQ